MRMHLLGVWKCSLKCLNVTSLQAHFSSCDKPSLSLHYEACVALISEVPQKQGHSMHPFVYQCSTLSFSFFFRDHKCIKSIKILVSEYSQQSEFRSLADCMVLSIEHNSFPYFLKHESLKLHKIRLHLWSRKAH